MARAEDDVGAGLGQGLGEGDAQPAGSADDDGNAAVELEAVEYRHGELFTLNENCDKLPD